MKIFLDFVGTVVEPSTKLIGRCNFGCFEVIKKLQDAGHLIILNTSYTGEDLEQALDLINNKHWMLIKDRSQRDSFEIKPIKAHSAKINPDRWDLDAAIESDILFIDDYAFGIPTKKCAMVENMRMVDWDVLDKEFEEKGLYRLQA